MGAFGPREQRRGDLTVAEDAARGASRVASRYVIASSPEAVRALADLLIGGADRDAVAVLAALGLRTLQGLLRVVDDPGIDDSSLYEPPRDRYSEMADQAPDTFDLG